MKEYNKKDIKEGMQLRCTDNGGWEHWTTGKVYTVFKDTMGLLVMQSDTGGQRDSNDIAQYLNGVAKAKFELLNEEDNKKMYTVGDKVRVLNNATLASKADGNFYKTGDIDVVGYVKCYKNSKGGSIRLGTHGSSNWIHFDMIELVEEANKEANKAINKVSDLLQTKIDELTTQAEHLFKKRDRLDEHAKNLNAKARRLEEVRDELNKFK